MFKFNYQNSYGPIVHLVVVESIFMILVSVLSILFVVGKPVTSFDTIFVLTLLANGAIFSSVMLIIMNGVGLYWWKNLASFLQIAIRLFLSFVLGFLALALVVRLVPGVDVWHPHLALATTLCFITVLGLRYGFWCLARSDAYKRPIVVIGAGKKAAAIENVERQAEAFGFRCLGFVNSENSEAMITPSRTFCPDDLVKAVDEGRVSEIVIALEDRRNHLPLEFLVDCRLTGVMISDYQTFCEREFGRIDHDALKPSWFFFAHGFKNKRYQHFLKRCGDVACSSILILLTLPLMALIALALSLESNGPVTYRQERVGFRGKPFTLLKFRSMRPDAEKDGVPQWAAQNDSRITKLGYFLRRSRLDELPQLFNVLKGEMSFVGPRPERPYFVEELKKSLPYFNERHRVKPGITGWAQVNFQYGASMEDSRTKLEYDLYYIKYYSVWLDLVTILQTMRVVLMCQGGR